MIVHRLARALALSLLLLPSAARADPPLTLEDAVKQALSANERALKAPLRVEAAEGALDKARAAFLPTLNATGAGTLHPLDKNDRLLASNGQLQLNQPLLNLSAIPLYAQARRTLESERWGAVQDKRLLAFDTARAYLVVLSAEHLLDAAKQRLERARVAQRNADAKAKAQLTGANDLTLATVDTASAARDAAKAEGDVAKAYIQLGYLVGRKVLGPLADPDRTMRAAESAPFRADEAAAIAEGKRPDVRSAAEKTAALREAAKEPLYRLAPTLGLQGQVKVQSDTFPTNRYHDESAQITLTWNIYDAGVRYADRRTKVAQAESQALDERALRRSIAADVSIALASLRAAREAYRLSSEAVAGARKHVNEVQILYGQGLTKGLDIVDANGRLYDAEVGRENARLTMVQAYFDLRLAVGLDPVEDEPLPGPRATPEPRGAKP